MDQLGEESSSSGTPDASPISLQATPPQTQGLRMVEDFIHSSAAIDLSDCLGGSPLPESSELLRPGEVAFDFQDPVVRRLSLSDEVPMHQPPPSGSLFKCAFCDALVYESQLDYHVFICPAPGGQLPPVPEIPEASPEASTQVSIELQETRLQPANPQPSQSTTRQRPRSVEIGRACVPQVQEAPTVSSSSRSCGTIDVPKEEALPEPRKERLWRQWQDSEIQIHHAEAEERAKKRRQQLLEEKQRKEEENCTFTPRLVARRSRSCGRLSGSLDVSGIGTSFLSSFSASGLGFTESQLRHVQLSLAGEKEWQEWLDQQLAARRQKLEQLDAVVYAQCTHKPEISPYAKAWAQTRELSNSEASASRPPSVFERLYLVAFQERQKREEARRRREAEIDATMGMPDGGGQEGSSKGQHTPRRAGLSHEHLYAHAMDKLARQKSKEEQALERTAQERKEACQVLSRSRRYYWQMLERQIKEAFEAATGGAETLSYSALEDFLRHFGVLRAPKVSSAVEKAKEESRKLRVALWRHLDPEKVGCVKELTLAVFFHVLMGAVDEEAQCLHNLAHRDPLASTDEDTSLAAIASAASGHDSFGFAQTLKDITPASANASLAAISEDTPEAFDAFFTSRDNEASTRGSFDAIAAASSAAAAADPEGRRICELLMRFDPKQLRAEFHQLYLDRMHYCASSSKVKQSETETHTPELCSQSRAMAEKVKKRLHDDASSQGSALQSHAELLLWRQKQSEARKEELRAQKAAIEAEECTFHPSISSRRPIRARSADGVRSSLGSRHDALFAEGTMRQLGREAKAEMGEQQRKSMEIAVCTFKPDTRKSGQSFQHIKKQSSTAISPRGYNECTQRLRKAFAEGDQRRRYLEDRYQAASPYAVPTAVIPARELEGSLSSSRQSRGSSGQARSETNGPLPSQSFLLPSQSPMISMEQTEVRPPSIVDAHLLSSRGGSSSSLAGSISGSSLQTTSTLHRKQAQAALNSQISQSHNTQEFLDDACIRSVSNVTPVASDRSVTISEASSSAVRRRAQQPVQRSQPSQRPKTSLASTAPRLSGTPSSARTQRGCYAAPPIPVSVPPPEPQAPVPQEPPRIPLVVAEVNLGPGKASEKIVLFKGDNAAEIAAEFAAKHRLTAKVTQRLHGLLKDLLAKSPPTNRLNA